MAWYIYIIESEKDGDLYKGISEDVLRRLEEHNAGKSKFTSTKQPWKLVFQKEMPSKRDALIEERRIKKLNKKSLTKLISGN